MKHVIQATIAIPDLKSIPAELLQIDQFRIELTVRIGTATVATESVEDLITLLRKLYADELHGRQVPS